MYGASEGGAEGATDGRGLPIGDAFGGGAADVDQDAGIAKADMFIA